MADNWNGSTSNWNVSSNWDGGVPGSATAAVATAGTLTVTDYETVGGLTLSGAAELLVDGGTLEVGSGQQGGTLNNFALGSNGAVLTGSNSSLQLGQYLTGSASGTVFLQGNNSQFTWAPPSTNFPGTATGASSTNLVVDFDDAGQGANFSVGAAFNGKVAGFQAGDTISWADRASGATSFMSSINNNSVTITDNLQNSIILISKDRLISTMRAIFLSVPVG